VRQSGAGGGRRRVGSPARPPLTIDRYAISGGRRSRLLGWGSRTLRGLAGLRLTRLRLPGLCRTWLSLAGLRLPRLGLPRLLPGLLPGLTLLTGARHRHD